jgi:hypothetical protein
MRIQPVTTVRERPELECCGHSDLDAGKICVTASNVCSQKTELALPTYCVEKLGFVTQLPVP